MVNWTLECNACDVLGLGPRAAGRLATVGVRTVKELLAATPQVVADKKFSSETVACWQREARLVIAVAGLPAEAARLLAVVGIASAERLARSTPTELIAKLEALWHDPSEHSWLITKPQPTSAEICMWIGLANQQFTAHAA